MAPIKQVGLYLVYNDTIMVTKKIEKVFKYTVIFEPAEEGGYVVHVPSLPGCHTQGETLEEAMEMVKDAISGYIASFKKHDESIPQEHGSSLVSVVDIPVIPA